MDEAGEPACQIGVAGSEPVAQPPAMSVTASVIATPAIDEIRFCPRCMGAILADGYHGTPPQ
ncbi:hypothetical protein JCM9534A_42520 [Catenuloplanes indicus JCM 9534]